MLIKRKKIDLNKLLIEKKKDFNFILSITWFNSKKDFKNPPNEPKWINNFKLKSNGININIIFKIRIEIEIKKNKIRLVFKKSFSFLE